jgi:drug/metabolite transporter (DMT)-like permease
MARTWWPVLGLVFNALVFGLSWWPLREMQTRGLHPLWATAFMYGFACVCIALFRPSSWRSFVAHPMLWWLFLGSGLTNFGFNWAVTQGDVVRVVLLFYTMPAWSVLLAWWLLDERPSRLSLMRLLLALCGVALVLKTPQMDWPWPSSAMDYLALLGGASFALNNAMLKKLSHLPETDRMAGMFSGGMALTALAALIGQPLGWVALPENLSWWPYALVLAIVILASNLSLQFGAARLAASTTSLVMLSEIVFASLSSVAMGASEMSLRKLVGGALIVLAAALAAWPTPAPQGGDNQPPI